MSRSSHVPHDEHCQVRTCSGLGPSLIPHAEHWRNLPQSEQEAITRRFWEVGRLTLEHWLTPRLDCEEIIRWPGTEVAQATPASNGELRVLLSNATQLTVDRVVFATGYRADLTRVPYLVGRRDGRGFGSDYDNGRPDLGGLPRPCVGSHASQSGPWTSSGSPSDKPEIVCTTLHLAVLPTAGRMFLA